MNKQFDEMSAATTTRRDLLRKALAGAAFGASVMTIPGMALAQEGGQESEQLAEIYQLYAAFLAANSYGGDINALAQLWADDAVLTTPAGTFIGKASILAFFANHAAGFTVPSVPLPNLPKAQFDIHGETCDFTVEHFYVRLSDHVIFSPTHGQGIFEKVDGNWLFWHVKVGPATL